MTKLTLLLSGSPSSPRVRKVRLAAATLRLPLSFKPAVAAARSHDPLDPLGSPVLLLTPDAGPLYDDRAIIAYLEHLSGVALRPPEALAAVIDQRIEALADGIADAASRGDEVTVVAGIAVLARDVDGGALGSEQVTAGALGAAVALAYCEVVLPAVDWRALHPALARWADVWRDLPQYQETAPH